MSDILKRLENLTPEKRQLLLRKLREKKQDSKTNQDKSIQHIVPTSRVRDISLSFAQQRLWFLEQLEEARDPYNESAAFHLEGTLNIMILEKTIQEIVRRHEILRTTFKLVNGSPIQVIEPSPTVSLLLRDLENISETEQFAEVQRLADGQSQTPFNLSKGPLLRTTLIKLGKESNIFLVTLHHIIADGWSLGIFIREISVLYKAFVENRPSPLPDLTIQYADFACWQRNWLSGDVLQTQLKYWKKQLGGNLPILQLPTDHPRPAVQTYRGTNQSFELSEQLKEMLKDLSKREGVTLFMTMFAAFSTLLFRYTNQEDIVIGSAIANRNRKEIEPLIGFFVNTLALRINLEGNPTFQELLKQVSQLTLNAYDHQDLPFEKLVEELQPERSLSYTPLFQVLFVLQNAPSSEFQLPGLNLTSMKLQKVTSKFDLTLSIEETDSGLRGTWEYSTDLFKSSTIKGMAGHFQTLLEAIVVNPQQQIGQLPLLTSGEKHKFLVEWNETHTDYPDSASIHQLFEAQIERTPNAVAVVSENEQLTYRELNCRANQLAHYLLSLGVGPEVLVGICIERTPEMIVGLLGILKAGGAYVPLDSKYPQERLAFMFEDTQVPVLITQQSLLGKLPSHKARIVCLDADRETISRQSEDNCLVKITSNNLAYVTYTSGSTGKPKGVCVIHRGVVRLVKDTDYANLNSEEVFLQLAPISFDASTFEIWGSLLNGARLVLFPPHLPSLEELGEYIQRYKVTTLWLTAGLFHLMVDKRLEDLKSLHQLLAGGDVLSVPHIEKFLQNNKDCQLINGYGPTENTTFTCCYRILEGTSIAISVPIGRPIANTQVYILDHNLQPVPIGLPGELYIGGDGLARGYLNRPELTQEKFISNPFDKSNNSHLYKSGDLVRYLPDSNIEFLGRVDNQVKIRGFRIEPGEIEAILCQHPQVRDVTVIPWQNSVGEKNLVAYFVSEANGGSSSEDSKAETEQWQDEHVTQWQTLYQQTYSQSQKLSDPTFNITGWNSSYTGLPIPAEEMNQWVKSTVERILSLKPQRVLEIGCGTGLLLSRIAPYCRQYLGTDFSQEALSYVEQLIESIESLSHVKLCQKMADDFSTIPINTFDVVILNSIVQYFPSIEYLMAVLAGAVKSLSAGGYIFVGDVRNLLLLKAFYADIHYQKASASLSIAEWRQRIQNSINHEEELLIDPAFFLALNEYLPQICALQIQIKRGHYLNELSQFRYDVILQVEGERLDPIETQWLDWQDKNLNLPKVCQFLEEKRPDCLGIKNIPNVRILRAVALAKLCESKPRATNVGELAEIISKETAEIGIEPEDFWSLEQKLPYTVSITWSDASHPGCYDVILRHSKLVTQPSDRLFPVQASFRSKSWHEYGSNPLREKLNRSLIPQLQEFLQQQLPDYMVPSTFVMLDALPLTPNGKVDRRALPNPDAYRGPLLIDQVAPRTPTEEIVAAIWADVLGWEKIGRNVNFFELGGHSLLATQVTSRLREVFHLELPVRSLFEFPTVAELSEYLEATRQGERKIIIPAIESMPREGTIPLSFVQESLWFLEQLEEIKATYNMVTSLKLVGTLQVPILEKALAEVVHRHEVLRTTFEMIDDCLQQVISPNLTITLPIVDLQGLGEEEQAAQIQKLTTEGVQQIFDLGSGPLVRVTLLRLGENYHVLLLVMHHIISDGWSMGIFVQELSSLYQALCAGESSPLSELPIQYADYALWQRRWWQGEVLETQLSYWREKLAEAPPLVDLPTDSPRPPLQTFRGACHSIHFTKALVTSLKTLSHQKGVTLFVTMLTALKIMLFKWSGQTDLVVGTVIAGRNRSEIETLIGCFMNFLALRSKVSPQQTALELIQEVGKTVIEAYSYQDCPFEQVVEAVNPERQLSYNPLYNVVLLLQNFPVKPFLSEQLNVTYLLPETQSTPVDLRFMLWESGEEMLLTCDYNTDLFKSSTIERMIGHFQTILEQLVANPQQRVADLPILTKVEREQLLVQWNDTQTDYPLHKSLHQLFEEQVERTPDAIAVIFEGQSMTYRDLNSHANQLAHHLQKLGIAPDKLVGICLERSLEMVIGLIGILKAGGAYVPLDPTYPLERLTFMLSDAQIPVLLTSDQLVDQLPEHQANVLCLDRDWENISQESKANPLSGVQPDNLSYVIYTSGSTGKPKGAMNTHRGIVNRLLWMQEAYQLGSEERVLQKTPFSFDVSVWEFFWPLLVGAKLVVARPEGHKDPTYLVDLIRQEHISTLHFVPSMLQMFLEAKGVESLRSLKRVICSGEALPFALQERFFERLSCELHNLYGPTEAAVDVTFWKCRQGDNLGKVPIGKPIANTQLYILDNQLKPVPIGVPGELHIGGVGLAQGYLNRPELTAEKFISNPFCSEAGSRLYKTGDLVRYLPDGNIEYLGRLDYQVKVRGFRIELGEIEEVLRNHSQVREAVVIADDCTLNKSLIAYVVGEQEKLTPSHLRDFLKEKLPDYMVPSNFFFLQDLPLTPNGKLDRRALPVTDLSLRNVEVGFVAPRDALEFQLAKIWSKVLGVESIGVRDNFFELGGNSLLAVRLMSQIQECYQKFPLSTLFQKPTIEQLATILRKQDDLQVFSCLVPIQPNGSKSPLFCVHPVGGNVLCYWDLAQELDPVRPFYGLQALGMDGQAEPHTRVEEMAAHYIEAIRTIQPQGPYLLAGWSFGGLVAFEMAQQLKVQGQAVSFLGLIDTDTPAVAPKEMPDQAEIIVDIFAGEISLSLEDLRHMSKEEQLSSILEQTKQANLLPPDFGIAQAQRFLEIQQLNWQAAQNYIIQPYSGLVDLFLAGEKYTASTDQDHTLGWGNLIMDNLQVYQLPGNHRTIINQPHVQFLAKQIEACLARLDFGQKKYG